MLEIKQIDTDLFGANSYVLISSTGHVLIVDPGLGSVKRIKDFLSGRGRTVSAVLLTHGHPDHVWESASASDSLSDTIVPVFAPSADRYWLKDPLGQLGLEVPLSGSNWECPLLLENIPVDTFSPVPGINMRMIPAPGHSPGSSVFLLADAEGTSTETHGPMAFTGDVVFSGSVGRTDLPGGDEKEMRQSLRTLSLVMDPETKLFPGHGPETMWKHELETNPYIRRACK